MQCQKMLLPLGGVVVAAYRQFDWAGVALTLGLITGTFRGGTLMEWLLLRLPQDNGEPPPVVSGAV